MKKTLALFFVIAILMVSCGEFRKECDDEQRIKQETLDWLEHYIMFWTNNRRFMIDLERITLEDGNQNTIFFEGSATQRMVDMYNYILRLQEPQILFNNRDIVVDDIFDTTLELHDFWVDQDGRLNGLLTAATNFFLGAWFGDYIDHDDVDGCWRGHTDWSYRIWR